MPESHPSNFQPQRRERAGALALARPEAAIDAAWNIMKNIIEVFPCITSEMLYYAAIYGIVLTFLNKYTKFLGENLFLQHSDLNSIYNYFSFRFPNEINQDKIFKYSLDKSKLDKLNETNHSDDLQVEITYQLI